MSKQDIKCVNTTSEVSVFECPPSSLGASKNYYQLPCSAFETKEMRQPKEPSPYLLMGFDTEYETPNEALDQDDVKAGLAKNNILSYQFSCKMSTGEAWEGICCPDEGERLSMGEFLVFALATGIDKGVISHCPDRIYLITHFAKADLPAFSDFCHIVNFLTAVRGSLASIDFPIPVHANYPDGSVGKLNVYLRDTMLITPGGSGSKSLETIGELVKIPKVKLSADPTVDTELKKQMRLVRDSDWTLFREYALTDARICDQRQAAHFNRSRIASSSVRP